MGARRILLLGGTAEAASLAHALIAKFGDKIALTNSLAGRTPDPAPLPGELRVGGFGGVPGLSDYLRRHAIDLVIDATHPFAAQISANAAASCAETGIPCLRLDRPPWPQQAGDHWIEAGDTQEAAAILEPLAQRIWLTIGTTGLSAFSEMTRAWFLIRTIGPLEPPPPLARFIHIRARGPFTLESERAVIAEHRIDALVTKASGGQASEAKLTAARERGIPVVMIRRPAAVSGSSAETLDGALDWVAGYLRSA